MQLKKSKSIRNALAAATSSMLVATATNVVAEDESSKWEIDTSILFYSEKDRITVIEPVVRARKEIAEDEFLNMRLVLDSLTGSSPSGAIQQTTAQTFSTPSGASTYTTAANQTPLDPSFHDTRAAFNVEWEKPVTDTIRRSFGANVSKEFDYTSVGLSAQYSWDFNQRNTTLAAGLSYNLDTVNPVGGMPVGLSDAPTTATPKTSSGASDTKSVADLLIGVTQVMSRNTLMQFNFTYGNDSGYLTDPYKILTVLDGSGNLSTTPYKFEKRPDSRSRTALYWKTMHQFTEDVLDVSYRYYTDDWGIDSHTLDLRYRTEMGGGHYLQPHVRYYSQGKADFYHYNLVEGSIPGFASADYRLGELSSTTFGLKYGVELDKQSEFSIRAEVMKQKGEGGDPVPDVDATIVQISYSLLF